MEKQVAVVTGGNNGIGLEVVRGLAAQGINVILGSRDAKKNEEVVRMLAMQPGEVVAHKLDLSCFTSVREFAAFVNKKVDRIDILVNNAGIMAVPERKLSVEGY
jgi:NAD(P)-dependent dehydrogenase (short-subunit alcohol dehydrogenase family)